MSANLGTGKTGGRAMNTTERVDVAAIITRLAALCPKLIFVYEGRRRPLAIGIRDLIIAKVGDHIKPHELSLALGSYYRSDGYLRAMMRPGAQRIDIEGNAVGAVSPEHAAGAAKGLAARLLRKKARREAMPRPVHSSAAPMSEQPKRLGLADLRQLALARRA
jgi:sRNA-binding protein